jgi:hypothetical protein
VVWTAGRHLVHFRELWILRLYGLSVTSQMCEGSKPKFPDAVVSLENRPTHQLLHTGIDKSRIVLRMKTRPTYTETSG